MKPFLQDVVQFLPLSRTLLGTMLAAPQLLIQILTHLGPLPLLDWTAHFISMGFYTAADRLVAPVLRGVASRLPPRNRYALSRLLDAWRFGAGADYQPPQ